MRSTLYHAGMHLKENELESIGDTCPICNCDINNEKYATIQRNPDVFLMECQICKGMHASKFPTGAVLENYYSNYYDRDDDTVSNVTFDDISRFSKRLFYNMDLNSFKKGNLKILDFGGGDGAIAIALSRLILENFEKIKTIDLFLVDYEASKLSEVDGIKITNKKELSDIKYTKFDVIMASAVLEHIPRVHKTISDLFSLANSGAYFYARTPNIAAYVKLSKHVDMTFPAHLHDLGASFWNRFIESYDINAKIVKSQTSIAETSYKNNFIRALVTRILKLPSYIEGYIVKNNKKPIWKFSGGWEIFIQFE